MVRNRFEYNGVGFEGRSGFGYGAKSDVFVSRRKRSLNFIVTLRFRADFRGVRGLYVGCEIILGFGVM